MKNIFDFFWQVLIIIVTVLFLKSESTSLQNIGYFLFVFLSIVSSSVLLFFVYTISLDPDGTKTLARLKNYGMSIQKLSKMSAVSLYISLFNMINIILIAKNGGFSILLAFLGFAPIVLNYLAKYRYNEILKLDGK